MGLLNWLDPELDNNLGNIFTAVADGNGKGLFSSIAQGMRNNRRDAEMPGLLNQLPAHMRPTMQSISKFAPEIVPELAMKQAMIDPNVEAEARRDAMRKRMIGPAYKAMMDSKTNPQAFDAFRAYAAQNGMPEAANWTPETVQMMAYEGVSPAPQQNTQLGMTPIWGTDAQGKPVLLQMGQGSLVQAATPQGVTLTPGVQMVNTGTSIVPVSNRTGVPAAAPIPIDVAGKAYAETSAKTAAENVASAPKSIQAGEQISKSIDGVLKDPALNLGTGALGVVTRNIPGTSTYDFGAKAEQLKGKAFLQAFESLRGGGQITQIEGQKATDAIARLDAAQSPQAYRAALQEFKSIVDTVTERQRAVLARGQGGMGQPPAVSPPPAQPSAPSASDPLGWR